MKTHVSLALAAGLVIASGEEPAAVFGVLHRLTGVRGRMQLAATRANGAAVFVDYAHTPDAIATALRALRPHVMGRIVIVFGAGGDRDRTKRPLMGAAAREFADVLFVTDDNPRSEDPAAIRAEIMAACPEANEVGDRAEAILRGVAELGGELLGAADQTIRTIASLDAADSGCISFLANPKYKAQLQSTQAGCVIVSPGHVDTPFIRESAPYSPNSAETTSASGHCSRPESMPSLARMPTA